MKIAIGSTDKNIEGNISDFFGRSPYFIIADIENKEIKNIEIIENKNIDQMSGAGISVAKLMVNKDVKAVIANLVGPRASDVLEQFDIEIYAGNGKIKNAIQKFIDNKLIKQNK